MKGVSSQSPRVTKGGIVVLEGATLAIRRVIALQYNPDSITRQLQIHGSSGEGGGAAEPLRLTGAPTETMRVDVELDATDSLETPSANRTVVELGLRPVLAALETLVYPSTGDVERARDMAKRGAFEILPAEAPLTLFVWSRARVVPVRFTELSIVEEAFDVELHPIRAKVSLGMQTLSPRDLGHDHPGSAIFGAFHKKLEQLARRVPSAALSSLGIYGVGSP